MYLVAKFLHNHHYMGPASAETYKLALCHIQLFIMYNDINCKLFNYAVMDLYACTLHFLLVYYSSAFPCLWFHVNLYNTMLWPSLHFANILTVTCIFTYFLYRDGVRGTVSIDTDLCICA